MRRIIVFIVLVFSFLFLQGCQSLKVKDSSIPIKKIALLSFYADNRIIDLSDFKSISEIDLSLGDSIIFSSSKKTEVIFIDKVINQAIQVARNNWTENFTRVDLVPFLNYLNSPAYQNFFVKKDAFNFEDEQSLAKKYFSSPLRYKILPLQKVVKRGIENDLFSEDVTTYKDLGDLATELEVDGVMLIKSKIGFVKREENIYSKLILEVLLVNRNGEEIVRTKKSNQRDSINFTGSRLDLDARKQILLNDSNLKNFLELYDIATKYIVKFF